MGDRHEGQTVWDLGRKRRQDDRQSWEIVKGKNRGNKQWNERMTQTAVPPIISFHTKNPNAGSQGIERQWKKALPVAAITSVKWCDISLSLCVCECACMWALFFGCCMKNSAALTTPWHFSLLPLSCKSYVYRCKLNITFCTIFFSLLSHTFLPNYSPSHRSCFLRLNWFI